MPFLLSFMCPCALLSRSLQRDPSDRSSHRSHPSTPHDTFTKTPAITHSAAHVHVYTEKPLALLTRSSVLTLLSLNIPLNPLAY